MKGITFAEQFIPMVLSGQKTVTRGLVKPQPTTGILPCPYVQSGFAQTNEKGACRCSSAEVKPRYLPGEVVYLKETWLYDGIGDYRDIIANKAYVYYKASEEHPEIFKWKSPMIMPEKFARCYLLIKDVRVARVQEITEEDAIQEGVSKIKDACYVIKGFDYDLSGLCHTSPITPFYKLFETIYPGSWERNDWVFRYKFEVTK